MDPEANVAADDVAGPGGGAAHRVVLRPKADEHAIDTVSEHGAGGVGADEVAGDHVVIGAGSGEEHAGEGVGRDDVAGPGDRAADRVVVGPAVDAHTLLGVAEGRPGGVDAEAVALDAVVGAARVDTDAVAVVAGDDVA